MERGVVALQLSPGKADKVKGWAFKKMAIQFGSFKKKWWQTLSTRASHQILIKSRKSNESGGMNS